MIRRPTSGLWCHPAEPQPAETKFVNESINNLNRIVLLDPVVQILWKERALFAINAFNKAFHAILHNSRITLRSESHTERFHTASVRSGQVQRTTPCPLYPPDDL